MAAVVHRPLSLPTSEVEASVMNRWGLTEDEAIAVSAVFGAVLLAVGLVGLGCLVGWCPTW